MYRIYVLYITMLEVLSSNWLYTLNHIYIYIYEHIPCTSVPRPSRNFLASLFYQDTLALQPLTFAPTRWARGFRAQPERFYRWFPRSNSISTLPTSHHWCCQKKWTFVILQHWSVGMAAQNPEETKISLLSWPLLFAHLFATQNPKSNRGTKPFSRIFSKDSCAIRLCSISSASSKPAHGLGLVRLGADPFYNWLTKGSFIGLQQEVLTPPVKKKHKCSRTIQNWWSHCYNIQSDIWRSSWLKYIYFSPVSALLSYNRNIFYSRKTLITAIISLL